MSADEWAIIERLFDQALQLPQEQRRAWLGEACHGHPDRREILERLIRKFDEPSRDVRDENPIFTRGQLVANRFRIVELIARGGMGEVYKARDQKLHDVLIALKTIRLEVSSERAALERFMREVWVPREISDDGVCRMFELVEHRQEDEQGRERVIPCLTMQFLDGETLAAFLARNRPLPIAQAREILSRIGRSLQVLHDNGIIHRDLKPSNIMLVKRDNGAVHPVIIDFGLAKRKTQPGGGWDTLTAPMPGAPYFLAPEVLAGHKAGTASDVYAFGLLIDTLVTERDAFVFASDEELLYRKLREQPERPSARSHDLPAAWERTILACLAKDPVDRPQCPLDVVLMLEGDTAGALPPADRRHWSRRAWVAGLGGAAAVSALSVGALWPPPLQGSVLVFPFRNLTTKPEFDHLCLGAETELIRRLRFVPGLQVLAVAKNWKPEKEDLRRGQLSLEGSLQFVDGSPVFLIRTVDNASGRVLEEQKVAGPAGNPAALQEEVASRTVEALRTAFSANRFRATVRRFVPGSALFAQGLLPKQASANGAALEEYQRGMQIALARTPASALEAIACFERATAQDPGFALAYAALADIRQVLLLFNRGETMKLLNEALQYAQKSVELDRTLPECHVALASALQNLWDWPASERSYLTAIEMNPRFPKAHTWFGGLILQFGRNEPALARARRGLELDPFDHVQQANYGLYLWLAGQTAEAVEHMEKLLQRSGMINTHINLGQAYATLARQSREPEATLYFSLSIAEASEVRNRELAGAGGVDPGYLKWSDLMFNQAHGSRGDINAGRYYARRLERGMEDGKISASAVARAYSVIDERRRAVELLGEGLLRRERDMLYVRVHPLYRNLHGEAGFQRVLQQMNLSG